MNLLSKLHKNSILTGPIESYCLACGCLLRSEEESYAHIHNPDHAENLRTVTQLENYKDDCILKSKEGYFCSYCNIILPTIKRVSLHVTDQKHRDNKNSQSITRHAGVIFAFDAVVIDPRSWHGLDGSTCSVCDQDYADEEHHKKEATHVLNLIQAKCQFGENFIYRKVDEDLFFCLICNDVLPVPEKPTHHESERHLQLYEKSKKEGIAIRNQKLVTFELNNNKVASVTDKEAIKLNQVPKDSKENKNTIEKVPENKTPNGSSDIINDNRTTTQKNTLDSVNLIKGGQKQESKSDSLSKPQEKTKIIQENKLTNQKESQLIIEKLQTPQEVKDKPKSLNTNTAVKATKTKKSETVTSKAEAEKPEPITSDSNGTSKFATESYLYEFLKARNFIIKERDGSIFCVLCDVGINEVEVGIHSLEKHHSILYAKHVARKSSKLSEKTLNGQDSNKDKDSKDTLKSKVNTVIGKEKTVPVLEQSNTNAQKASKDNDKPAEVSKGIVAKVSEITDKNTVVEQANNTQIKAQDSKIADKTDAAVERANNTQNTVQNSKLNKENTAPENNAQNGISIHKATEEETQEIKPEQTNTAQPKRAIKKAQRRAAKAKTTKTGNVPPSSNDRGIPTEVYGHRIDATAEEHRSHTEASSTTLIDESKQDNKVESLQSKNDSEVNNAEGNDAEVIDAESKKVAQVNEPGHADLKTEKLLELIKTVSQVDSAPDDVVINSKYVLGNLSFVLIVRTGSEAECVACDEELTFDKIHKHIAMDSHRINVEECLVVTSLDDEFIRKVKTQEYHCGYCNMVLPSWEDMKLHLQSYRHSDAKTSASWRLERYHPHLRHCQTREVRSVLSTIFRCTRE